MSAKPVLKVYSSELKHYAATYLYSPARADTFEKEHPWIVKNHIKEELVKKLSEAIKSSVEEEAIDEANIIMYRLDIWLKE